MTPPTVSVVIPMRDEIDTIETCIRTFDEQDYPSEALDVVVVDGMSTDGSRELVLRLAEERPWLRLIDNPGRIASAAFNRGIEAARGDFVCIVSSHGSVGSDFVSRSLHTLRETGAAGVGGRLLHAGRDRVGRAIGLAMTSPFGMASPFRYSSVRRPVDTIGHPVYLASVLREVGPFDESLERNSDYELNQRIRARGHVLMFDPGIITTYHPRSTLSELAHQFWDYGRWKARITRRDPSNLRWRHAVPPFFVLGVITAPAMSVSRSGRLAITIGSVGYVAALVAATASSRPRARDADLATFVTALPVMHFSWGAGFLRGLVEGARGGRA